MGNSLTKLPLTSPWEQWEDVEKQNCEAIYSLSPQERGTPMLTDDQTVESIHGAQSRWQDFALKPFDCPTHRQIPMRSSVALLGPPWY
jgi:hypothetical protein